MSSGILQTPMGPADHYLGPAGARVILVEYGDYECPHCRRAHEVIQSILPALAAEVRLVFRNFPLAEAHPHAQSAAEAAESVAAHGGNDAFWTMHARVRAEFKGGVRSGVNGTPTFFVNGRRFDGNWADAAAFTAALRHS